jgi:hypothetical protein
MRPDSAKIDDAALAMLFLTSHRDRKDAPWRAWKGLDWEALGRLHAKGLISDPVGKAKSVGFSDEGHAAAEAAFRRLCCGEAGGPAQKEEA